MLTVNFLLYPLIILLLLVYLLNLTAQYRVYLLLLRTFLLQKDVNFIQTYTPAPQDTTASLLQVGRPLYYAYFDQDNFILHLYLMII